MAAARRSPVPRDLLMMDGDLLHIPVGAAEAEHSVRGSLFIAVARHVSTLEEAARAREAERRRFHDATHHVLGARLVGGEERSDDDGEPSGTGGRQVIGAIDREGLSDVAVVVTRYYGGTKLGTGGLGRAYSETAMRALVRVPRRSFCRARRVRVSYAYGDTGVISRLVAAHGGVRVREGFGERAVLEVAVPADQVVRFLAQLTEVTGGRVLSSLLPGEDLLPSDT